MQVDKPHAQLQLPQGLLKIAHSQWAASCLKVCVSQLHNDVADTLRAMGLSITIEQLTEDKLFSIDIALPGNALSETEVCVFGECDCCLLSSLQPALGRHENLITHCFS